jgi:hypothetical protein
MEVTKSKKRISDICKIGYDMARELKRRHHMKGKREPVNARRIFTLSLVLACMLVISPLLILSKTLLADGESASFIIAQPDKLTVNALDAERVELAWNDNSDNEDGFRIERSSDRSFSYDLKSFIADSNATSFTDSSTEPLTIYYYRVLAYNSDGESIWSNIAIILTPDRVPSPPSHPIVSSPEAFVVNLSWTDNSDNEAGFKVERAIDKYFTEGVITFTTEANVFVCQDKMVPGGDYYYRVIAYNSYGDSLPSDVAEVKVDSDVFEEKIIWMTETSDVELSGFVPIYVPFVINGRGLVQGNNDIKLNLVDGRGSITITKGLKMLNVNEHALLSLSYEAPDILPEPPADNVILQGYEFDPQYSTFNPGIKVT